MFHQKICSLSSVLVRSTPSKSGYHSLFTSLNSRNAIDLPSCNQTWQQKIHYLQIFIGDFGDFPIEELLGEAFVDFPASFDYLFSPALGSVVGSGSPDGSDHSTCTRRWGTPPEFENDTCCTPPEPGWPGGPRDVVINDQDISILLPLLKNV